uniref:Phage terminase large subunit n=1 Tax=uncultured marine virus TaxID=186617 RepID=A0A0F7L5C5_9VIRU|nr:phage terminase large subunit [uncultured marine virus]
MDTHNPRSTMPALCRSSISPLHDGHSYQASCSFNIRAARAGASSLPSADGHFNCAHSSIWSSPQWGQGTW